MERPVGHICQVLTSTMALSRPLFHRHEPARAAFYRDLVSKLNAAGGGEPERDFTPCSYRTGDAR